MGARSHKKHRNQRRRENSQASKASNAQLSSQANASNTNNNDYQHNKNEERELQQKSHVPACVQTLLMSTNFAELEEACNDLMSYAIQLAETDIDSHSHWRSHLSKHHHRQRFYKVLVDSHIPQRLMSLMAQRQQWPLCNNTLTERTDKTTCENNVKSMESTAFSKELLYTQIAACSTLRTLLNSCNREDEYDDDDNDESENMIADVLLNELENENTEHNNNSGNGKVKCTNDVTECLLSLLQSVWQDVEQSAEYYALHKTKSDAAQTDNTTEITERTSDKEEEEEEEEEQQEEQMKRKLLQDKAVCHDDQNSSQEEANMANHLNEQELEEEEEEEEHSNVKLASHKRHKDKTANKLSFYFVHLRFFDELVQLFTVLADSSSSFANFLSSNESMEVLLHALQAAFMNAFKLVHECQNEHKESAPLASACTTINEAHTGKNTEESYKVAELYASVAIAISELLNAIAASDHVKAECFYNIFTAATLTKHDNCNTGVHVKHSNLMDASCTVTKSTPSSSSSSSVLIEFVKHVLAANELIQWQNTAECHVHLNSCVSQLQVENTCNGKSSRCINEAKAEMVLYMLCEATINIQSTLMSVFTHNNNNINISKSNEESTHATINLVLPLITSVLKQIQPMEQWRHVLPLFGEMCPIDDEEANPLIKLVKHRLHAVWLSLKLFHTVVNTICERNESNEDDEVAFRNNPFSADLYRANSLVVFATVLKDVLWLGTSEDQHNPTGNQNSTMSLTSKQAHDALTARVESNPEASFIQYMLLNMEGVVWDVACTLLLMIPVHHDTIKYDQSIWQAVMACVQDKYKLLLISNVDSDNDDDVDSHNEEQHLYKNNQRSQTLQNVKEERTQSDKSKSVISSSPATKRILWQHIESIVQLLWTLLRKDMKVISNSNNNNTNNTPHNHIQVRLTDLKLLLALSNFSTHNSRYASTRLRQALIGTMSLLSKLLGTVESTKPVVECACTLLLHSHVETTAHTHHHSHLEGTSTGTPCTYTPLLKLGDGIVEAARVPSTLGNERHEWVSLLHAVDGVVSLRCEAANALIDLFIDERFDSTLYGPLQIQQLLRQFLAELRVFTKKRVQLSNWARRHYKLDLEVANLEQWQELEENLCGFVQYKQQHGFA